MRLVKCFVRCDLRRAHAPVALCGLLNARLPGDVIYGAGVSDDLNKAARTPRTDDGGQVDELRPHEGEVVGPVLLRGGAVGEEVQFSAAHCIAHSWRKTESE